MVQQSESQDRRRRALKNKTIKKKPDAIATHVYIIYKMDYMCRLIVHIKELSSGSIERGGSPIQFAKSI